MCSQNLTRIRPSTHERSLEVDDLVVRPRPLLGRGEALDALDEHTAVPAAIEHAHPAEAGDLAEEAAQEVMPLLVGGRRGVRLDRVVAGIEVLDDALDRPTLAAGIATLEDDEQAGPDLPGAELPAEVQAQLEQTALGDFDASLVLAARQPLREVELVESLSPGSPAAMLRR